MSTTEVRDQAAADADEVLRIVAEGRRVTDPELLQRVHEEARRIRQQVLERHGVLDIGVPAIRELRDS